MQTARAFNDARLKLSSKSVVIHALTNEYQFVFAITIPVTVID